MWVGVLGEVCRGCMYVASLIPRTHPADSFQYNMHNTESDPCWGWFGSGTKTSMWLTQSVNVLVCDNSDHFLQQTSVVAKN